MLIREYLPVLITGAMIGGFALMFIIAYFAMKSRMKFDTQDRHMSDGELTGRLLRYAKPYWKQFVIVFFMMVFSIAFDLVSPLISGHVGNLVKDEFELRDLYTAVAVYASILIVSMVCTYFQSIILQKTGQKIISNLRLDLFSHIEGMSHE